MYYLWNVFAILRGLKEEAMTPDDASRLRRARPFYSPESSIYSLTEVYYYSTNAVSTFVDCAVLSPSGVR
jgi:hypothetical protein